MLEYIDITAFKLNMYVNKKEIVKHKTFFYSIQKKILEY